MEQFRSPLSQEEIDRRLAAIQAQHPNRPRRSWDEIAASFSEPVEDVFEQLMAMRRERREHKDGKSPRRRVS